MTNVLTVMNLYTGLSALAQKELEAAVSFKVARNLQILNPIVQAFEKSRNTVLFEVVGADAINPNGTIKDLTLEQRKVLDEKLSALLQTEEDTSNLYKIALADLKGVEITPDVMFKLTDIITE